MIECPILIFLRQMSAKVVENYTLTQKIGAGQYGSVFLATHQTQPGQFAVKVMNLQKFKETPKLQEFTNNEIAILSKIDHPNIIKLIEVLKTNTHYFLIYEYCQGGTLQQLLKKRGAIPETQALQMFYALREAFIVLFKANILHRDLKPSNILFKNGVVKIADFGFCKQLRRQNDLTQTMVGSPIYMAPEVLKGEMYDAKADIWSLGVILYQILYGVCPYMQNSIPKLISLHQTHHIDFPTNTSVSPETIAFIKQMLTLKAIDRIDPYNFIDYVLPHMRQSIKISYKEAGKYMRKALIYLTQTLEQLTTRINQLPYLRMAFLVFKIISSIQEDTLVHSVFWQNLEIDIRGQQWESIIISEAKIAKPYGDITRQAIKKYDTGLKSKVELQTKYIDVRYFLESTNKIYDQNMKIRLLNCFLFSRHFSLVKEKRPSKWIDPTSNNATLKQKQQICNNCAKYY